MIDLSDDMKKICDLPIKERHSYFQLQYFVIGKEPTNQSKMWRCVQELRTRKESLLAMEMEIEEIQDDMEILNMHIQEMQKEDKETTPTLLKIKKIEIRKLERKQKAKDIRMLSIQERLKVVEEECVFLIKAFKSLNKVEELKPQDDLESQKAYWNELLAQDFNLRNKLGLPPDMESIKTILALNSESNVKQDLLNVLNNQPTSENEVLMQRAASTYEKISSLEKINQNDI
jgi:hypothetical protein